MSSVVEFLASGFTEKQGHCQVCRTDRRGTGTPFRTSDTMLDCEYVKNTVKTHTNSRVTNESTGTMKGLTKNPSETQFSWRHY